MEGAAHLVHHCERPPPLSPSPSIPLGTQAAPSSCALPCSCTRSCCCCLVGAALPCDGRLVGAKRREECEAVLGAQADMGGYKEYVMEIQGERVYSKLKFESGVHRVQRVPATESQGRVHTSTATVAVMPEVHRQALECPVPAAPFLLSLAVPRQVCPWAAQGHTWCCVVG